MHSAKRRARRRDARSSSVPREATLDDRDRINPYAAPAHSDGPEPLVGEAITASGPYTSNAGRTFALAILLGLTIPLAVAQADLELVHWQDALRIDEAQVVALPDDAIRLHWRLMNGAVVFRLGASLITCAA